MKEFFLPLLLVICLVINFGSAVPVKVVDVESSSEVKKNELHIALEKLLKVDIKKKKKTVVGGCVNNASVYETNTKKLLFVKDNSKLGSDKMFQGELEGLKAIQHTKTVLVPNPIAIGNTHTDNNNCTTMNCQHFIVMEYLKLKPFKTKGLAKLGRNLANMHLYNLQDTNKKTAVKKFGFPIDTSCGFILQNNTWTDDWITFFTENRLAQQINLLQSSSDNSTEKEKIINGWPQLKKIIPKFFEGINVKPSLLHGDLWPGNVEMLDSEPVLYDPAVFYGHHEYDIATAKTFGDFPEEFHKEYNKLIPLAKGFEKRSTLYTLFHYLNHWNHFGEVYSFKSLETFENLLNMFK